MRPSTKYEKEVVELSEKLAPLTSSDYEYAENAGTRHIALYSGKRVKCTDCGHEWSQQGLEVQVRCPHCGRLLKIENTRSKKKAENVYMLVLQAIRGWQVCRFFRLRWVCPVKGGRTLRVDEVVQRWVNGEGKVCVIARKRSMGFYIDSFSLDKPMSLKRDVSNAAYNLPYYGVIVKSVLPVLRRNGFKYSLYGMRPTDLFQMLLLNPFAETLLKTGYAYLLRMLDYRGVLRNEEYVAAARIAIRNRYPIDKNNVALWFDLVADLVELGKDVRNKFYVCPTDLHAAHQEMEAKVKRKREKEQARREAERLRAEAERARKDRRLARTYAKRMKKYFGLVFTDGRLKVQVLKSIKEFEEEGKVLDHCVFTRKYYAREFSLIMSARVNGKRYETVEVDLKNFRIIQCQGFQNHNTKYHDRIVSLVNANMGAIQRQCAAV